MKYPVPEIVATVETKFACKSQRGWQKILQYKIEACCCVCSFPISINV